MQDITPEQLYKIIGQNVAKYRKQKGLSQLDLSLQMGYKSVSVVSGAEIYYNGKHFNLEHLLKISSSIFMSFLSICSLHLGQIGLIFIKSFGLKQSLLGLTTLLYPQFGQTNLYGFGLTAIFSLF